MQQKWDNCRKMKTKQDNVREMQKKQGNSREMKTKQGNVREMQKKWGNDREMQTTENSRGCVSLNLNRFLTLLAVSELFSNFVKTPQFKCNCSSSTLPTLNS